MIFKNDSHYVTIIYGKILVFKNVKNVILKYFICNIHDPV